MYSSYELKYDPQNNGTTYPFTASVKINGVLYSSDGENPQMAKAMLEIKTGVKLG